MSTTKDKALEIETREPNINITKLYRKVDIRIMPLLCLLYLLSILDRNNMGFAKNFGIVEDLGITEQQFSNTISVFFILYSIPQIFSNLILEKIKPTYMFSISAILWGSTTLCMMFSDGYLSLLLMRLFLGLFEACLYPGIIFYVTCWYVKRQHASRIACFMISLCASGILGAVISYFIEISNKGGNLSNWKFLFIIEGAPAVILGVVVWYYLCFDV